MASRAERIRRGIAGPLASHSTNQANIRSELEGLHRLERSLPGWVPKVVERSQAGRERKSQRQGEEALLAAGELVNGQGRREHVQTVLEYIRRHKHPDGRITIKLGATFSTAYIKKVK